MKLKILTLPNPILRTVSQPVEKIDAKVKKLVADMIETVTGGPEGNSLGVGLSAIQVGQPLRLFVLNLDEKDGLKAYINPEIVSTSDRIVKHPKWMEGCLSIPGYYGPVKRPRQVTIKYQDLEGEWQTQTFTKFPSTVVQHEFDHLNGVMFIDHLIKQDAPLFRAETKNGQEKMIKDSLTNLPASWTKK